MSEASQPATPGTGLSTTAIAVIATGIGVSLICIIALIVLLVRVIKNHKQLLADLEERGVCIDCAGTRRSAKFSNKASRRVEAQHCFALQQELWMGNLELCVDHQVCGHG